MGTAVFSYHNWAFEMSDVTITVISGAWETNAPLNNVLTTRTSQLAIATSIGNRSFKLEWRQGSPQYGARVDIIALLNHNIIEFGSGFIIDVYDSEGGSYTPAGFPIELVNTSSDGTMQSHMFWNMGETVGLDRDKVFRVVVQLGGGSVTGSRDEYTGEVTPAPFQFGGIWAGPRWQPTHGISLEGFGQSVADNSRVSRSIGGQVWASPETRQRVGGVEFAGLLELEVYDLAPAQSLQQLANYCGMSRPLVVIPVSDDSELVYLQGMYGYLITVPKWSSVEKVNTDDTQKRLYTGSLEIMEAR